MKLTKEIIRLFKYHGFMTVTAPDEDILKCYRTVEDLTNAGFVNDSEALRMAKMVFVEDGTPAVGPTKDEDVVETPVETVTETTEEPVIDTGTEKETETTTTDSEPTPEIPAEEPVVESDPVEEPAPETVTEPEPAPEIPTEEPVTESDPVEETTPVDGDQNPPVDAPVVTTEPKKTKKTTTKKSTKKES